MLVDNNFLVVWRLKSNSNTLEEINQLNRKQELPHDRTTRNLLWNNLMRDKIQEKL